MPIKSTLTLLFFLLFGNCIPVPTGQSVKSCKNKCQENANLCYVIFSNLDSNFQILGFQICNSEDKTCKLKCNSVHYDLIWIIDPVSSGSGSSSSGSGGSTSGGSSGSGGSSSGSSHEISPEF